MGNLKLLRPIAIGAGDPPGIWGEIDLIETNETERAFQLSEVIKEVRGPVGTAVYLKVSLLAQMILPESRRLKSSVLSFR